MHTLYYLIQLSISIVYFNYLFHRHEAGELLRASYYLLSVSHGNSYLLKQLFPRKSAFNRNKLLLFRHDGAQITVPERVSYKTKELSLSLMPGNQTIKGETLLKYFRYFLTPSGGGAIKQSELLCVMFSQYINKTYLASGRNYFSQIVNSLDTDISIVDFSRCESTLSAMAARDIDYSAVSSVDELNAAPDRRGK